MTAKKLGFNYADQIDAMRRQAAGTNDTAQADAIAKKITDLQGELPKTEGSSGALNGTPQNLGDAGDTPIEAQGVPTAPAAKDSTATVATSQTDTEVEEEPEPAAVDHAEPEQPPRNETRDVTTGTVPRPIAKGTYKKPGITLYPSTEKQVAEMLYYFAMNGVQIPGKKGVSLFARAGIDALYDLFKDNPTAFLDRMYAATQDN